MQLLYRQSHKGSAGATKPHHLSSTQLSLCLPLDLSETVQMQRVEDLPQADV